MKSTLPILAVVVALLLTGGLVAYFILGSEPVAPPIKPARKEASLPDAPEQPKNRPSRSSGSSSPSSSSGSSEPTPRPVEERNPVPPPASRSVEISGVVADSAGGVPGVRVVLISGVAPYASISEGMTSSLEKAEGQFTFTVDRTASKVRVALVDSSWAVGSSDELDLKDVEDAVRGVAVPAQFAGTLDGNVRAGTMGNLAPLAEATVDVAGNPLLSALLGHWRTAHGGNSLSSPTGKVSIRGIPPGSLTFTASKAGYSRPLSEFLGSDSFVHEWSTDGDSKSATFTLTQAGGIRGRAVAEVATTPVPGALVSLSPVIGDPVATTYTGDDGIFHFPEVPVIPPISLPAGMGGRDRAEDATRRLTGFVIRIAKQGTGYGEAEGIQVKVGETTDVGDVLVKAAAAIHGRVTDAAGNPIEGADVQVNIGGLGGGRDLGMLGGLIGQVRGLGGVSMPKSFFSATTDANGLYRIDPVKPAAAPAREGEEGPRMPGFGTNNEVSASGKGYVRARQTLLMLEAGQDIEVNLTLQKSGAIAGTVTDPSGVPIPGVRVIALPGELGGFAGMAAGFLGSGDDLFGGAVTIGVTSAEDGTYRIDNLDPATYTLSANHKKYNRATVPEIGVTAGNDTTVNIVMKTGSSIFGVYYDEGGKPKPGATVSCISLTGLAPMTATTDDLGAFEFNGLSKGTYTLKGVAAGGNNPMARMFSQFMDINPRERARVGDADRVEHNVYDAIPGTTTLRGTVTLDGQPYVGQLSVGGGSFSGIAFRQVSTDAEGKFELKNIELGTYGFMMGSPMSQGRRRGGFTPLQQIQVRAETLPYQDVKIDFVTVTIRGTVTMSNGAAIPEDTIVYANPVEQRDERGLSSAWEQVQSQLTEQQRPDAATGSFEITSLSPGRYFLTARSNTGGFVRMGPINALQDVGGLQLVLDGSVGRLAGTVENYVPRDDAEMGFMSAFSEFGSVLIENAAGDQISLGQRQGMPSNSVRLAPDATTGISSFTMEGIPVGTWNITFQISNYAPSTLRNVTIAKDTDTPARFVLAPAGKIMVQITNSDLGVDAAQQLRYEIRDSKGAVYKKRFTFADLMRNMFNPPDPGKQNSFLLEDFPPDTYTFTFELPGYESATAKATVFSGQETAMPVTFRKK